MNRSTGGILSGLIAGTIFVVALLVLKLGLLLSALVAVAAFAVLLWVFPTKKKEEIEAELDLKTALREAQEKLSRIRTIGNAIGKADVAKKVGEIAKSIEKILATIAEDPKKLKAGRKFLDYYLDTTVKIVAMYAELSAKDVDDGDVQKSLAKVEGMLGTVREAFEKQLAQLLSGDVLDLDTELEVLEKTIDMEGLGKNG